MTSIFLQQRLWIDNHPPTTTVHDFLNNTPNQGEIFTDQTSNLNYVCASNDPMNQLWNKIVSIIDIDSAVLASQADWTQGTVSNPSYIKNKPSIPAAQIQSDWNQTNTGSLDYIKNKPSITSRSQSSATRALNTAFQISSTRWASVRYSIDISTTVSLTGSQVGNVILEMATNSSITTGVQTLQTFTNGNSGTLVIGLVLTQLNTACLSGDIPPGNYVRLRTVNVTGTPTFTYQTGQEVLV